MEETILGKTKRHTGFTNIKDIDLKILSDLNDDDLFNLCSINNRYIKNLCKDEFFWRNRLIKKYGSNELKKQLLIYMKPEKRSFKKHYLKIKLDLEKYSLNPWNFFDELEWQMDNSQLEYLVRYEKESIQNVYWFLNLGNDITIRFPVDDIYIHRKCFTSDYFTPYDILNIVYNFYQEPTTPNELAWLGGQMKKNKLEYIPVPLLGKFNEICKNVYMLIF